VFDLQLNTCVPVIFIKFQPFEPQLFLNALRKQLFALMWLTTKATPTIQFLLKPHQFFLFAKGFYLLILLASRTQ